MSGVSHRRTPTHKNTLLSYFSKSPKDNAVAEPGKKELLSTESQKLNENFDSTSSVSTRKSGFVEGDIVWAKMGGYPWWPGIICQHPSGKCHLKSGKCAEVHVQFFDSPPTHAWIKSRNVKSFDGEDPGENFECGKFSKDIRQHAAVADKYLKLTLADRLKMLGDVQLPESKHEDANHNGFKSYLDSDMFDDEAFDEDVGDNQTAAVEGSLTDTPRGKRRRLCSPKRACVKRKCLTVPDSGDEDSGDEFIPPVDHSTGDDSDGDGGVADSVLDFGEVSELPLPQTQKKASPITPISGSAKKLFGTPDSSAAKSRLTSFSAPSPHHDINGVENEALSSAGLFHNKLDFLKPDKIRDVNRRTQDDPEYDPRSLYVPESFMSSQTPAMRQWWELKSQYYDTVLFFKMGKFYELFHMDSTTGVEELGLVYMKGDHAHSGFPEIAYQRYADTLVQKGYKVARIEQMETPEMMSERVQHTPKPTKFDKVVKREICQVSTRGTRPINLLDGDVGEGRPNYLMAICEMELQGLQMYGVCFIDTSIGMFHLGQFTDDRHGSRLRTLFAHHTPAQVLQERGRLSQSAMKLINSYPSVIKESLSPVKEFWESGKTLRTLHEEEYFREKDKDFAWPKAIKGMISNCDALGLTCSPDYELAIRSLGAVVWYLQHCLLDQEMLSMRQFALYQPPDIELSARKDVDHFCLQQRSMVLDAITLSNLEITENSSGGSAGTLLEQLDSCTTQFGKRLLRRWVCCPLCQPESIEERLDAVEELVSMRDTASGVGDLMRKLPDLERLLSRIHILGSEKRVATHPDCRAILFEEATYSKRKIEDFLSALSGFKTALKIADKFSQFQGDIKSKLLRSVAVLDNKCGVGGFPDISKDIDFFELQLTEVCRLALLESITKGSYKNAFNHEAARKDGVILPSEGVDEAYDEAISAVHRTEQSLTEYLEKQRRRLCCKGMTYWGTGKNRFQLEVPDSVSKQVPEEYELMSSRKGVRRYRTKEIESQLRRLTDAEERKDAALKDVMRSIFYSFDERYDGWSQAVGCLAVLDCLLALALFSCHGDGVMCRPLVVLPTKDSGDVDSDSSEHTRSKFIMVTGPNMGGKSTLMRQTGLIVLLAHLGCHVPAQSCRMSSVDRIFTRLGANDRIMAGESTFFVELSETSTILQHATCHSLVLVDELGRGTATHDGTAIAYAVVRELSERLLCRTLFSTHYHCLVDLFTDDSNVRVGHMACMVDDGGDGCENITFLYKFTAGNCPKSYGFNAARLADIPTEIVEKARVRASDLEKEVSRVNLMRQLWRCSSARGMMQLVEGMSR